MALMAQLQQDARRTEPNGQRRRVLFSVGDEPMLGIVEKTISKKPLPQRSRRRTMTYVARTIEYTSAKRPLAPTGS
jgi:hypothetical protein